MGFPGTGVRAGRPVTASRSEWPGGLGQPGNRKSPARSPSWAPHAAGHVLGLLQYLLCQISGCFPLWLLRRLSPRACPRVCQDGRKWPGWGTREPLAPSWSCLSSAWRPPACSPTPPSLTLLFQTLFGELGSPAVLRSRLPVLLCSGLGNQGLQKHPVVTRVPHRATKTLEAAAPTFPRAQARVS